MPRYFSDSSVAFLRRYQFLPRHTDGHPARKRRIPTDSISLIDVMIHINTIFAIFLRMKRTLRTSPTGDDTSVEAEAGTSPSLPHLDDTASNTEAYLQDDMVDFDAHLSEEVLAPLLLAFLEFYADHSIDTVSIRQSLRVFLETTPYLKASGDDAGEEVSPYSSPALLFVNLTKALLRCHGGSAAGRQCSACPMLPWLQSRAEYAVRAPTWYWDLAQHPRTTVRLLRGIVVYHSIESSSDWDRVDDDDDDDNDDAIVVSHIERHKRKMETGSVEASFLHPSACNERFAARGIAPLPYDVQEFILEHLSPRALSAAISVCGVWRALIRRSATMQFYLHASRAVTNAFVDFMENGWGRGWVRVDELTTLRRLGLQKVLVRTIGYRLLLGRRLPPSLELFVAQLYKKFGPDSLEWNLLGGLWNAIEVEMKLLPFVALSDASFPSLFLDGTAPSELCNVFSQKATKLQLTHLCPWVRQRDVPFLWPFLQLVAMRSQFRGALVVPPSTSP
ncbi:hypothetical protein DQ04_04391040 [Trypanosoma grayi]|uniref:hypothetical protein n=1 Tax=Trypanosoma grayi TaxID=71804 RepID=UPI0004F4A542|nr:hypothetical protein DQ04_04391040 [Trypanosoma grayi]KEG09954.1 hypothetical protein DQ04_04391040 [Trypanosoma grayi]